MSNEQAFLTIKKATKIYGISAKALRKWEVAGLLQSTRTPGNTRMYRRTTLESALGLNVHSLSEKRNFCYCRVSSKKQSDDLERQSRYIGSLYPQHTLLADVGPGINFSRKGLQTILECAMRKDIGEVVVAYRDRLARFGFDLIESIVIKGGGYITVLDNQLYKSKEDELTKDLLAIIHVFNCRQMGKRRYSRPKSQGEIISDVGTEEGSSPVVRDVSVCV